MGLFNFFKEEFIEVIEWVEQSPDIVLSKYPDKDRNIKYGASLTVRESQSAIFVNEGEIADVYGAGRHELVTQNMPILTTLKHWTHGFNSPFKADVYFVSTRQFTNLKWGTANPIMMRDPEFKQVRVQAFGVYFIRIADPKKFFTEFAGTHPILYITDIEERMRDIVAPKFAEALAEAQVSVLDMVANYSEIGAKLLPLLKDEFEPFGIELTKFQVSSTTLPPEVIAFYDKMTNMNMVNDMEKFKQFQQMNAIEEAAKNGGSVNQPGMDMAGMMMANMMVENMKDKQQNSTPPPPVESKDDVMKMLKELGELKAAGILTEEEFNQKKTELLAKL